MKKTTLLAICICFAVFISSQNVFAQQPQVPAVDSTLMTIISDSTTVDGIRIVHYKPSARVCSKDIEIHVKDGVIQYCHFTRGCSGNTQGVSVLIKGMRIEEAIAKLDGIQCGRRGTSCPDQLANALKMLR